MQRRRLSPSSLRNLAADPESVTTLTIDDVVSQLQKVQTEFENELASAETIASVEAIRVSYLGKKGPVQATMTLMRSLSPEDKPKLGQVVNKVKEDLESAVAQRKTAVEILELEKQMEAEAIDVTIPGLRSNPVIGRRHPLSITMQRAVEIFTSLGYDTVTDCKDSPEIESDYYCFEALNCPRDHPARDMQDTFYLSDDMGMLLRTHTSSVQIRQLEKRRDLPDGFPMRIVAPGRVYRKDDIDATHSMLFHQVEILAIEERGKLNLGHLKGTVEYFLKQMLGPDIQVRFRGSYFPFTEPSMEVDVFFRGRWLEVLGCGMVDPNVLTMAGIDPEKYGGFAAGFGVERFAMVIHEITDIREFYKNDKRFLEQFPHFYDEGVSSLLQGKRRVSTESETPNAPSATINSVSQDTPKASESKATTSDESPKSNSNSIDISKLDIRVGVIKRAWEHTEAEKLFCEEIDLGEPTGPRSIASGLRQHYKVEDLIGRRVLVLANLKERKLVGFPSHGMVLCSSSEDGTIVRFVDPPSDAVIGERVICQGFEGEPVCNINATIHCVAF